MYVFRVREYLDPPYPASTSSVQKMRELNPNYSLPEFKIETDEEWRAQEFAEAERLNNGWIYFFADLSQDL